jgi:hypothetical protein
MNNSDADLDAVIDTSRHPIDGPEYTLRCRREFEMNGSLILERFITESAHRTLIEEADRCRPLAFFSEDVHNVYLGAPDTSLPDNDARSRAIVSTKGAVTTDQLPADSHLRTIHAAPRFRRFLCDVLNKSAVHEYADPLSSINVNFYEEGQELGWHFDNSEFSVTLLLQNPVGGAMFEFVDDLRSAGSGDDNEQEVAEVVAGNGHTPDRTAIALDVKPGSLVLFRGRDALHRVTPVEGDRTRILVVLAYNTEPGLSLSEAARMTFFGRLG